MEQAKEELMEQLNEVIGHVNVVKQSNEQAKEKKLNPSYMYAVITKRVNDEDSAIKAYAAVTLSNAVTLHGIRLIESDKGMFVAMPQKQAYDSETKSGKLDEEGHPEYENIVFPITKETREDLNKCLMDAYNSEDGYSYISANKNKSRAYRITPTLYARDHESIKASGSVEFGGFVCKDVVVALRERNDNGNLFPVVNFPNYCVEKKDGTKTYIDYMEFKEDGHGYDFTEQVEKEKDFKLLAKNIIIKEAKKVNPEIEMLLDKDRSLDSPIKS
ncbi:MAG: hypothetical protein E7279_01520 [Lachnospiraceae bacterium]|nr:hypothetical protein [Lachnospiraceae bacterium]